MKAKPQMSDYEAVPRSDYMKLLASHGVSQREPYGLSFHNGTLAAFCLGGGWLWSYYVHKEALFDA